MNSLEDQLKLFIVLKVDAVRSNKKVSSSS